MPGGSQYQGPMVALELYTAAVDASSIDSEVKGAKNPYTSRNGHMFSFLDRDGTMALRLSDRPSRSIHGRLWRRTRHSVRQRDARLRIDSVRPSRGHRSGRFLA